MAWFSQLSPIAQAFLAACFCWTVTASGAAAVFLTRELNRRLLDNMQGFALGVMIAPSYCSLLAPAIEMAEMDGSRAWLPVSVGFLAGGLISKPLLPYALSFAAGAMIFVVVGELIRDSHRGENHDLATLGALGGFTVMMVLDVAFG